jgi:hypothetical protein
MGIDPDDPIRSIAVRYRADVVPTRSLIFPSQSFALAE